MNEITLAKRQVQLSSWKAMVETRQASGLTIPVWCRENGVTESAYYYRLRQVRTALLNEMSEGHSSGPSSLSFYKVEIEDSKPASHSCSVVVHLSGADIDVHPGADHTSLATVFRALRESC